MGWNSWNEYACHVNERIVQQTMDAFISSGLLKLGYKYVNIDDCWLCSRADDGTPIPCSSTFPNGMKSLADYAHSLNLLFGIYSDAGFSLLLHSVNNISHKNFLYLYICA